MVELHESLRRIAAYRRIEQRLFEVLGAWVAVVPEPGAKILLGRHCYHHAWHAELWEGHLGRGDGGPHPAAPSGDLEGFLDAVADPGGARGGSELTMERLAGSYRVVVPRLIAAYRRHLEEGDPVSDGPVLRTLRLVLDDEVRDWREGEALLHSMIDTPQGADRAARRVGQLEGRLTAVGGLLGEAATLRGRAGRGGGAGR